MMKYYKYENVYDHPLGKAMTYLETDRGVAIREITTNGKSWMGSNVKYPPWGVGLPEGQVDYDAIEDVIPITQEEFDGIWKEHLKSREAVWANTKRAYPLQTIVNGHILIFFPQGVIVDLGGEAIGVADYQACNASTKPEFMYPKHRVTALVTGYDEVNQWLVLGSPKVHAERLP